MKVTLVIPCYNEARRLHGIDFETAQGFNYVFVNDGSTDETATVLNQMSGPKHLVLSLGVNQGKAEAVRLGMLEALKKFPESEWIGYWDADMATPLNQVEYMLKFAELNQQSYSGIFGSRILRLGALIDRSFIRHLMGRVFVTYTSIMLNNHTYDSQCGAKLFRPQSVAVLFREPFISRWFFDLEIIQRMEQSQLKMLECPLQVWKDIEGSKIKPFRDGLRAFFEVLKIKRKYAKN